VLGLEIHMSGVEQASARGAALIAATALDPSSASSWEQTVAGPSHRIEPSAAGRARYDDGYASYRRLRTVLRHGIAGPSTWPGRGGA